jgi:hypothetical protein
LSRTTHISCAGANAAHDLGIARDLRSTSLHEENEERT